MEEQLAMTQFYLTHPQKDNGICSIQTQVKKINVFLKATGEYGGVDVQIHSFLTSTLGQGEWTVSCPGPFITVDKPSVPTDMEADRNPVLVMKH